MKLISKRGRTNVRRSEPMPGLEVVEYEIIVTGDVGSMTADEIKAAEEVFKRMRKQLEDFGKIISP